MPWDPELDLAGDRAQIKISATDVASDCGCGRHLAFKARPKVHPAAWRKWFSDDLPFVPGLVLELVAEAHLAPGTDTYAGLRTWLMGRLDARGVGRLLRPYVEAAVENALEAHSSIEDDLGPLRLLTSTPIIGSRGRELTAWAPLYTTADGTREIRRVRLSSAHEDPSEGDRLWAATAAHVAATFRASPAAVRVRVVEIGLGDGSSTVLFDGTPDEATAAYDARARARASALLEEDHVLPGFACGGCKAAGVCDALVQVDGMLGQDAAGVVARSIAPTALQKYAECPARWLLEAEMHLPKEVTGGDQMVRGNAVHRWLEAAHGRGVACRAEDLPDPATGLGLADGRLSPGDYALAHPYLVHHVGNCPLAVDEATVVAVEQTVYGWDDAAQVVPVTKPDLVYRLGDRLIIRETKSMQSMPIDQHDAYSRHLQVPFMLVLLASGLEAEHGATAGAVELEILGPDGAEMWAWETDDPVVMAVARADVRRAVEDWHVDTTWDTRVGPHCAWCPVREWCPDRDVWQGSRAGATPVRSPADPSYDDDEEPPPF